MVARLSHSSLRKIGRFSIIGWRLLLDVFHLSEVLVRRGIESVREPYWAEWDPLGEPQDLTSIGELE